MRQFFFQINSSHRQNILHHPLFGLPNVHLLIDVPLEYPFSPPGFGQVPNLHISSYAWNSVNWLSYVRSLITQFHPHKEFKYGFWPMGWVHKNPYGTIEDSSYDHEADRIEYNGNKYPTSWHKHGIAAKAKFMDFFFRYFKQELVQRNFPLPTLVDVDDESLYFNHHITGDLQLDFDLFMADPRATREKIDGLVTLREYCDNFKTLSGQASPLTRWPAQYSLENYDYVHMYNSLNMRIRDYVLWYTCFVFVKKYLGYHIPCHNWYHSAANQQNPAFGVRFKETWIDYNKSSFRMDAQVYSIYEVFLDHKDLIGIPGLKTWLDAATKYQIPTNQPWNKLLLDIYYKDIEYNLQCNHNASYKPKILWFSNADYLVKEDFIDEPTQFTTTLEVFNRVWQLCDQFNVQTVGCFEPELTSSVADKYYESITSLPSPSTH